MDAVARGVRAKQRARRGRARAVRVLDHGGQRHRRARSSQSHPGDPDYNCGVRPLAGG